MKKMITILFMLLFVSSISFAALACDPRDPTCQSLTPDTVTTTTTYSASASYAISIPAPCDPRDPTCQ